MAINSNYKTIISWLFKILSIVCIVFIGFKIKEVGLKIDFSLTTIIKILIVTIAYTFGLILLASSWQRVTEKSIHPLGNNIYKYSYLKTLIGKYLPGNVFHLVGRNTILVQKGAPAKKLVEAFFIDNVLYGLSSLFLFSLFAYFITPFKFETFQINFAFIIPILIACLIGFFIFNKKYKFSISFINYFLFFVLCSFCFCLLSGVSGLLILKVLAIYPLSWLLGYLAVGSPGGIGIREFMLITILGPHLGEDIILSSAIQFRLCNIFAEAILFFALRNKDV